MMDGTPPTSNEQPLASSLTYARELAVLVLAAFLFNYLIRAKVSQHRSLTVRPLLLLLVGLITFQCVRSAMAGVPIDVVAFGLRSFALAVIYAGLRWIPECQARDILYWLAVCWIPGFMLEAALAVWQTQNVLGYFGTTALGPRPWGTLASPNNLSAAFVASMLLFYFAKPPFWRTLLALGAAGAFITGSRSGVLGAAVVLGMIFAKRFRARLLLLIPGLLVGVLLLAISSSEAVSGRQIEGEGRFAVWAATLSDMSLTDILLGQGVGFGSNATIVAYGLNAGAMTTDSQPISMFVSFGLVGASSLVVGLALWWTRGHPDARLVYVPTTALLGLVYTIGEYAPANLLLILVAGATARRASMELSTSRPTATTPRGSPRQVPPRMGRPRS